MYAILDLPLPILLFISFLLSLGSAVFSGLTLGMMTQDLLYLKIASISGEKEGEWRVHYAKKLLPLRLDGNFLLVTLLFGNVTVNTGLSILISELTSGWLGFTVSTILILILGEIVPQAICSRYGLYIGGFFSPFIRCIQIMLYPILRPISFILDKVVGKNGEKLYSKEELLTLLEHHSNNGVITSNELRLINRILFSQNDLSNIVSSIKEFPTISVDSCVDYSTFNWYMNNGITRVYVLYNSEYTKNKCDMCNARGCRPSNSNSHIFQTQNGVAPDFYINNTSHYTNQTYFPVKRDVIILDVGNDKSNSKETRNRFSEDAVIRSPDTDDTCDSDRQVCHSIDCDPRPQFNGDTIIGYINLSELKKERNDISLSISSIINTKCFRRLTSIVISADTMSLLIESGDPSIMDNISNIKDKLLCIESRTRVPTLLSVLCRYNFDQRDVIFVYSSHEDGQRISFDGVITQKEVFNHLFL